MCANPRTPRATAAAATHAEASYDLPVRRALLPVALAAIALVVGGYLFAVLFVPRGDDEPDEPTPVLVTTTTIPAAAP
jgi:hypothetical protein